MNSKECRHLLGSLSDYVDGDLAGELWPLALTGVVSRESAEKAVLARVPEAFLELNKKAFNMGYEKAIAAKG